MRIICRHHADPARAPGPPGTGADRHLCRPFLGSRRLQRKNSWEVGVSSSSYPAAQKRLLDWATQVAERHRQPAATRPGANPPVGCTHKAPY
ncbi:hypothetical protein V5799_027398 [Amblyomma americanum]|uniref:Uncharacterized protein n=1 Tax=Amblyomma americanum TaxID=6943 RepID=A0AAQ4DFU6_AMBAM